MIGTILKHRYEVIEKIGEGNLFTVYRCEDKIDNRQVAVKILLPQYAANRMFAERILVEAQAMVGFEHPGVVEVYDSGEENGNYYVIVEYVRGVDLKERIRRHAPYSLSTVVDVGLAICEVSDFAHRKGFVHGDLRPGNILVTPEGKIRLADFWVTNAIGSSPSLRTNALMRSVHYMAPEVAEGKPATPASDIYSIGIILFELLTGTVPFDGDTPIAIALKHSREAVPSLRALNPGVPKTLESVVAKALQKSPQERFRSARAMHNELRNVRDGLNLSKPITWSEPTEKTVVEPLPEPDLVPDEVEEGQPVVLNALRKTLMIIIGLITLGIVALAFLAVTSPSDVRVPELMGKNIEEARKIAHDADIELIIRSEQFNEDNPAGTIYYMNPAAGRTIKAGKSVDVWVSRGSKFATAPDVVKLTTDDAKERIYDVGLSVGQISQEYSDSIPAGNVMLQNPEAGTRMERGQPVSIVYSLGPKSTYVPQSDRLEAAEPEEIEDTRSFDIKFPVPEGKNDRQVQIAVEDKYGTTTAFNDIAQPGEVIEQTVEGIGDKITIRIYIDGKLAREERKWR